MIKVAIIRHNGLFYGGTERFLQIMAASVNKDEFQVDYYTTDEDRFVDRECYLKDNHVSIVKFKVNRHIRGIHYLKWRDLWKKFNPDEYDVIQVTNFGRSEYPYNQFTEYDNVCEFCVFPPYIKFPGVKETVLNSEWVREEWINSGGNSEHSRSIPVPVNYPTTLNNLRSSLNISSDAVICGFHQRNDDNEFSPAQLQSYKAIESDNTHMLVLNGSKMYQKQAQEIGIRHITFLEYLPEISPFLNTLDIYTHGRSDGETYGTVLAEAMIHRLPCLSHRSLTGYNAMQTTIGPGGYVATDITDYVSHLISFIKDKELRKHTGELGYDHAVKNYTYGVVVPKIEQLWKDVSNYV